jgi:hypothetical protein
MLIHLLNNCAPNERDQINGFLIKPRSERTEPETKWLYGLMESYGSIEFARRAANQLAGAAMLEALTTFRGVPDTDAKRFILEMILYVVRRDR